MSFVIAVPETIAAAATDLADLGSTIAGANAAAFAALMLDPRLAKSVAAAAITSGAAITNDI